jgi:hypothetical protein
VLDWHDNTFGEFADCFDSVVEELAVPHFVDSADTCADAPAFPSADALAYTADASALVEHVEDACADALANASAEASADTRADSPANASADTPADTSAFDAWNLCDLVWAEFISYHVEDDSTDALADTCADAPADASANASAYTSAVSPADASADTPADSSADVHVEDDRTDALADTCTAPTDASADAPAFICTDASADTSADTPANASANASAETRADACFKELLDFISLEYCCQFDESVCHAATKLHGFCVDACLNELLDFISLEICCKLDEASSVSSAAVAAPVVNAAPPFSDYEVCQECPAIGVGDLHGNLACHVAAIAN